MLREELKKYSKNSGYESGETEKRSGSIGKIYALNLAKYRHFMEDEADISRN
jgi:hypothetical protein